MKICTYTHLAQYYETDKMGIIHHSNYIRWFEEARVHFLKEIGYPYDRFENELKLGSPVLETGCQYRSMVHFGDTVDISARVAETNGIRIKFAYEVRDHETGELKAQGFTRHCFLNADGRPVSLKRAYPELNEVLNACAAPDPQ